MGGVAILPNPHNSDGWPVFERNSGRLAVGLRHVHTNLGEYPLPGTSKEGTETPTALLDHGQCKSPLLYPSTTFRDIP